MESGEGGQMISTLRPDLPLGAYAAGEMPAVIFPNWINIGHAIDVSVWDAANRVKDREDEALDAMRTCNGMTLDQFLDQK